MHDLPVPALPITRNLNRKSAELQTTTYNTAKNITGTSTVVFAKLASNRACLRIGKILCVVWIQVH